MADWDQLDEKAEWELHKNRLLPVEYRPFKRLVDRVASISSVVNSTVPLNSADAPQTQNEGAGTDLERIREELTIDFVLFDDTIHRLQFLHDANRRERERYQVDQQRIIRECESAVAANTQLREQLEAARATLAQRKKFDDMADKITANNALKPREEQIVNLAKLEEECKELERESETYSAVWKERRDQFNKIMEEGMLLRRQIRDEKEEVDRREGMDEGGDDEATGHTPRPDISRSRSGSPEDGEEAPQSKTNGEDGTPQAQASFVGTPARDSPAPSQLHPDTARLTSISRAGSQQPISEANTPAAIPDEEEAEDEVMEDQRESKDVTEVGTPQVAIDPPEAGADKMDVDN